jgi:DNA polymerase-3 subunit gamma/tau
MSYQVLARKWRPQSFHDVVGQEHVLKALINALENQRLHHAYLFTGTRGVGKTTLARILARCLNCETGITSRPCGECSSCQEITAGNFIDLIEVDAASRTKVDDTRDLMDNVQYAPSRGRYKVYLIDEVHMLSTHSFNALLKTLEEPPEHVKFLLATTDPQKLPVTVLSRCLQFNLKNMSAAQISEYLDKVLASEQITFDQSSLELIAQAASGSMRDALSLTDQAIAHGNGNLAEKEVANMLGTVDRTHLHELLDSLVKVDGPALISTCALIASHSVDYQILTAQLLNMVHAIAVHQQVPEAAVTSVSADRLQVYADQFDPEQVQLLYQMLLVGRQDIQIAPDPESGFEMLMLRLLAFSPRPENAEGAPSGKKA